MIYSCYNADTCGNPISLDFIDHVFKDLPELILEKYNNDLHDIESSINISTFTERQLFREAFKIGFVSSLINMKRTYIEEGK